MSRIHLGFVLAAGLFGNLAGSVGAQAQYLPEPRCGGTPPATHRGDLSADVVGFAGEICYGQVFSSMPSGTLQANSAAILSIKVVQQPRQGRLVMTGLREFSYKPNAKVKGWDTAVLRMVYEEPGNRVTKDIHMRLTNAAEYKRMEAEGTLR